MKKFINILKHSGNEILKGTPSHNKLAPHINGENFRTFTPSPNAYNSAVLILLRESMGNLQLLFTLRSSNIKSHRGQISFPGGRVEDGESYIDTALRETKEEIGIQPEKIEVLKQLSTLYVPLSNALIHPFVGILTADCKFILNHQEVEDAFWVDFNFFLDENNIEIEKWDFNGKYVDVPLWKIHPKQVLWGATAMLLSEFIDIYKDIINFEK